jgi:hypothetical protein
MASLRTDAGVTEKLAGQAHGNMGRGKNGPFGPAFTLAL